MAIKTGTITARPTKYGAKDSDSNFTGFDAFIAGTGALCAKKRSTYYPVFLYGMDFRALQGLPNLQITNFTLTASVKNYSYTGAGATAQRFVTDFQTSGTDISSYTDVGGREERFKFQTSTGERDKYYAMTASVSEYPDLLNWMNLNIDKVINGFTTNSFGIRARVSYQYVEYIEVTLNYTYEEPEPVTITTAVSPTGAGTVTPTHQIEAGSIATITATPNAGYKFSHWLINGADSGVTSTTLSGTVTENLTATAVFAVDKIYVGISKPKSIYVGT